VEEMKRVTDKLMNNMRGLSLILIAITIAVLTLSCQKAEEPKGDEKGQVQEKVFSEQKSESQSAEKKEIETKIVAEVESYDEAQPHKPSTKTQSEEMVPLVTEVMTNEEFQAYLKEKNIPIITKEDFKEPELVWEKTFDVPIEEISDLTEKGNSIALSTSRYTTAKSKKKVLMFIDSDGNIQKKLEFRDFSDPIEGDQKIHLFYPAMSGRYVAVYKIERDTGKTILTYYDEEGNRLWSKDTGGEVWPDEIPVIVSYNGEVIATASGNPYWNLEEERVDVDLNINKLKFFDSKGKVLSEYGGFMKMSIGKLSDNGKYFVGILWWSKGIDRSRNKLIYIRTEDGKVLWEKPFPGYYNIDIGDTYDLVISEQGTYVAAVKLGTENFRGADAEVHVFDKDGKLIKRIKGSRVNNITEDGLIDVWDLADISERKKLGSNFNLSNYLSWKEEGDAYHIVSIDKTILWKLPNTGFISFSKDGKYLKVLGYLRGHQRTVKIIRLRFMEKADEDIVD
jgi:outer membrane protein assembly factor BamB